MPPARALQGLVDALVRRRLATAAVALVGDLVRPRVVVGAGELPAAAAGSLFDLASLTKPWTASLAVRLDAEGRLPLALPVGEAWPAAPAALARRPLADLLRQRAGYRPWAPLYRLCRSPERVPSRLLEERWLGAPRSTYSDLGYVLWGLTAERATGRPLAALFAELEPWAGGGLAVRPGELPGKRRTVVPCRLDNAREVELAAGVGVRVARRPGPPLGVPQDGNARFLGGLAGHAGLFGTAEATWRLGCEWLRPGRWLPAAGVERALAGGGRFALGWRRRTGPGRRGFGHLGFTGGGLWIDPERGGVLVLLCHRRRVEDSLRPWQQRFRRLAATL